MAEQGGPGVWGKLAGVAPGEETAGEVGTAVVGEGGGCSLGAGGGG